MVNGLSGTFDPVLAPELIPEFVGTPPPGGPRQDELPMPEPEVPDVRFSRRDQLVAAWKAAYRIFIGGRPPREFDPEQAAAGRTVETPESIRAWDRYLAAREDMNDIAKTLKAEFGFDPWTSEAVIPESDYVPATGGERLRDKAAQARLEQEERQKIRDDLELRAAAELKAKRDVLLTEYTNAIARGDLSIREADRKFRSEVEAAGVESELLRAFAGRSLPAGTEFFPGFSPTGAFGTVYGELAGDAFPGLRTGGTFEVNPGALAAQIRAAGIAESALPTLDLAQQTAMAELAGLTGAGQGAVLGGDRQTATAARQMAQVDIPLTPTQTQVRRTHPTRQAGVR